MDDTSDVEARLELPTSVVENPAVSAVSGVDVQEAPPAEDAEQIPLLAAEFTASQVNALRGEFGVGVVSRHMSEGGVLAASVKGVFAQLTECPMNWHQCTVFMCTSTEPSDVARGKRLFVGSWLIIILQLTAVLGALRNTDAVACASNNHCTVPGMYCEVFPDRSDKSKISGGSSNRPVYSTLQQSARCGYCGRVSPVPIQLNEATGEVYNLPAKDEWDMLDGDNRQPGPHFIKSAYTTPGYESVESWRHDFRWNDYAPVGVPEAAMAANVLATATIPRGFNWTMVKWVCAHPNAGHLPTGESAQLETARSPLPVQYVKNWW
jgi:hypothetical protein